MVAQLQEQKRNSLRLLVVEDDPDTADALAFLLRTHGHEVQVALDAASAVLAADAEPVDVVLLDIGLPGADGYEVARQLREGQTSQSNGHKVRPVIIAVTGRGEEAERLRAYEAGMDLYLIKPVQPEELERILDRLQGFIK
jgi:DNA-binding response OmpR family regulator